MRCLHNLEASPERGARQAGLSNSRPYKSFPIVLPGVSHTCPPSMLGFLAPQQLGASLLRHMEAGRRKSDPMAFGYKRMWKEDPGHEIQQEVATVGGRESGAHMHRFAAGCRWM